MSLFRAKEWWSASVGEADEVITAAVGNFDNEPEPALLKLATGSLSGKLRVYRPRQRGYSLEDLLLEAALELPVLQLAAGRLTADSTKLTLAVLHPRALSVYRLVGSGGGSDDGPSYHALECIFSHALERPSYNLLVGTASGSGDFACVQSMDGLLTLLEKERAQPPCQLSKFLLPGPLTYCANTDALLTFNSQLEVDCYRRAHFAPSPASTHPRLQVDWSVPVGEHVTALLVARLSRGMAASQVDIVVVAERLLLYIKENGSIRNQKRLDYSACCAAAHSVDGSSQQRLVVGGRTGAVMVYSDMELLWAARLPGPPATLGVHRFGQQPGLLLSLLYDGTTTLSYLGTTPPPPGAVGAAESKQLNYEAMDAEHRRLLGVIREASTTRPEPAGGISLRAEVPLRCDERGSGEGAEELPALTVRLMAAHSGVAPADDVSMVASCAPPLFLAADHIVLPPLIAGDPPAAVPLVFRARPDELPVDLSATVVVNYSAGGELRCASCELRLPLRLVADPVEPLKTSGFRLTIETNRPPLPLGGLFEDMVVDAASAAAEGAALSIVYGCGLDATVLASKKERGRYRVCSSRFEGLWLLTDELVRRLRAHGEGEAGASDGGFAVWYEDSLPLREYFEAIDDHLASRRALVDAKAELEQRARQLRAVEKRLLVRLKDRVPAPIASLEALLEGSHHQLLELAHRAEEHQAQLRFHAARVSAGTRLLLLLLRLKFRLGDEEARLLEAHLSPLTSFSEEASDGWEERTAAALTHLLHHGLKKRGTGAEPSASPSQGAQAPLAMPADAAKVKKSITLVCDRLNKGSRPGKGGAQAAAPGSWEPPGKEAG